MIRRGNECQIEYREHMRDGDGTVQLTNFITGPAELCGKGRLFSRLTLNPGCGIGYHVHEGDSELFFILKGTAEYSDNGTICQVSAGDVTICPPGQGHSITLALGTPESPTKLDGALFRSCRDCVIQNLHVDGSIVHAGINAAGFIRLASGFATLRNCRSSVVITEMRKGNCYDGGFVGSVNSGADLTIEGCIFDGKLLTTNATSGCSGFVGDNKGTVAITDSLYSPLSINSGETEVNGNKGFTFVKNLTRNGVTGTSTITNSYYTRTLGTAQGKLAHTITAGENVTLAPKGKATAYSVSGITAYADNDGLKYGDKLYAGN